MLAWQAEASTVNGEAYPSNGRYSVADPRAGVAMRLGDGAHTSLMQMCDWGDTAATVTGATRPGGGALSVADPRASTPCLHGDAPLVTGHYAPGGRVPRLGEGDDARRVSRAFDRGYSVLGWTDTSPTIAGISSVGCGAYSVADPRKVVGDDETLINGRFGMNWRLCGWETPCGTITCQTDIQTGAPSVSDPRRGAWETSAPTAAGITFPAVAPEDRIPGTRRGRGRRGRAMAPLKRGVPSVKTNARTESVSGSGSPPRPSAPRTIAVTVDLSLPGVAVLPLRWHLHDARQQVPFAVVLPTADGAWHRPLTTLELLALQGFATFKNGRPVVLHGSSHSGWRRRIGNAVPPPAARRIAVQMLYTLLYSDTGTMDLTPSGGVWVRKRITDGWRDVVWGPKGRHAARATAGDRFISSETVCGGSA